MASKGFTPLLFPKGKIIYCLEKSSPAFIYRRLSVYLTARQTEMMKEREVE